MKKEYFSAEGQSELMYIAKSLQPDFCELEEGGQSLGWESGERGVVGRIDR